MPVYTVLEPLRKGGSLGERADHVIFLRDGFSWTAFLFTPLWLICQRLWLTVVVYSVAMVGLQFGLRVAGVGTEGQLLVGALIALLFGLEAANLRRWAMTRRGSWRELATVVAGDRDEAEQRFFDAWVAGDVAGPAPPTATAESIIRPQPPRDVVGLFPEPGGRR
jgi:hypothetical protein